MESDRELLPVVEVGDMEFLVDVRRREFRGFRDPEHRIDMHTVKGREMVRAVVGREWRVYGADNLPAVFEGEKCRGCSRPTAKS